jgi:hypothetical protein
MAGNDVAVESDWLEVIARTLAHFALQAPEIRDKRVLEKADFLEGLGFASNAAASLLGTTSASIRELRRQKKGKKNSGRKQNRRK